MRTGTYSSRRFLNIVALSILATAVPFCAAIPSNKPDARGAINLLNIARDLLTTEPGPPLSEGALKDPTYLPAQIGSIVGSYVVALVLVAIGLLALAKSRREHLRVGEGLRAGTLELPTFQFPAVPDVKPNTGAPLPYPVQAPKIPLKNYPYPLQTPRSPYKNFSYPDPLASPTKSEVHSPNSPVSTIQASGYDLSVDQSVVQRDREMAQQQLENMYKHVMEQEEAKQQGRVYEPPLPSPTNSRAPTQPDTPKTPISPGRRSKPASLNFVPHAEGINNQAFGHERKSRTSSLLNRIGLGKKDNPKGLVISSPLMTPVSATFPRNSEGEEMAPISPRLYVPPPAPPVPSDQLSYMQRRDTNVSLPLTPNMSPTSVTSIDGRLDEALARLPSHSRGASGASAAPCGEHEAEPVSAVSETSTSALVGLPSSPKPGASRFSQVPGSPRTTLPASPKPGQSFQQTSFQYVQRQGQHSAVRLGGELPLRAEYKNSLLADTTATQTTTFAMSPLSPGLRGPITGMATPYSPYVTSPCWPVSPRLMTQADRRLMKKLEPKTPTVELVKSQDETW